MKIIIYFTIVLSLFSSVAQAEKFSVFCSSGGFLYNHLQIDSDEKGIHFHAWGYPWGFEINHSRLDIPTTSKINQINFTIENDLCSVSLEESPKIECQSSSVKLDLKDENENSVLHKTVTLSVDLTRERLLLEQAWIPVINQSLRYCVDVSETL